MSCKLVIVLFISLCTGTFGKNLKIVGGKDANVKDFPHSASIREANTKKYHCGGSIISKRNILTAAHCCLLYDSSSFVVYVGKSAYDVRLQPEYAIAEWVVHPEFTEEESKESMLLHDIAIITLVDTIRFNRFQNKINLARRNPPINSLVTLASWGAVVKGTRTHPKQLQKATFKVLSNYECAARVYFNVHNEHMCVFAREETGACYGDSGSGLIFNGEIVGVASFVHPCAAGKPDVYMRVHPHLNFITSHMRTD